MYTQSRMNTLLNEIGILRLRIQNLDWQCYLNGIIIIPIMCWVQLLNILCEFYEIMFSPNFLFYIKCYSYAKSSQNCNQEYRNHTFDSPCITTHPSPFALLDWNCEVTRSKPTNKHLSIRGQALATRTI